METLFVNKGPYEINKLIRFLKFSEKKKLKKKNINNISNLIDAKIGDLTYLESSKYLNYLKSTKASYCIIHKKFLNNLPSKTIPIISTNPLLDFIILAKLFYPDADTDNFKFKQNTKYKEYTKKNIFIDYSVKIGKNFKIGLNTILKKNVLIGNNVRIGSNCVISNSVIGDNTIINDGSIVGKIGYGFKYIDKKLHFVPHIGHVKIGKNVYIGANCTIDRGSFSNTIIGNNTMIDNLVHLAHNVKIGDSCFIAGQVGIAGSTQIGNQCLIGGQAGISGHLKIGNNVQIGGGSGVLKNLEDNAKVIGYPAKSIKDFLKS